jgi:hypothetical protein
MNHPNGRLPDRYMGASPDQLSRQRQLVLGPIDPVKALDWNAVLNSVVTVPVIFDMIQLSMRRRIIPTFALPLPPHVLGWVATIMMAITVVAIGSDELPNGPVRSAV